MATSTSDIHSQIIAELDDVHMEVRSAFERRDLAAYRNLCCPELTYRQANGQVVDRDALMRDVAVQFRRLDRAQWSFVREHVEIDDGRATEILRVNATVGVTAFLFVHRTWNLTRKGRYTWRKDLGQWRIESVEVLEEQLGPGNLQFGLRPPSDALG